MVVIMLEVNVTMLRNHLQEYLARVQKGAEVCITLHGTVIAKIISPIDEKSEAKKKLKNLARHSEILDVVSPINERWAAEE